MRNSVLLIPRFKTFLHIGVAGILICGSSLGGIAAERVNQVPAHISIMSHSINSHGDARSQIFHADFSLKSGIGLMAESAEIADEQGSVVINQLGAVRQLANRADGNRLLYAFAGVAELTAEDTHRIGNQRAGLMLGLGADYAVNSLFSTYARVSVANLARALWIMDAGLEYSLRPNLELALGYRGYEIGGSSLGGPVAGITYSFQQ